MSNTPEPDELLTPEAVRARLGISEATYFRWLREGKLRGVRAGRNWRFPASGVEALLTEGTGAGELRRELAVGIIQYEALLLRQGVSKDEVAAMAKQGEGKGGGRALVQMVLEHAVAGGASSVHLDHDGAGVRVRERIDGALATVDSALPRGAGREAVAALKELAGIGASGTATAAAGRFDVEVAGRHVQVWAATYPCAAGDSMTLRLHDARDGAASLAELGFAPEAARALETLANEPSGAIIVTGPHGAGKTTTIYALIERLRQAPNLKIMTAEDPVETPLSGVQQAEVGGDGGLGHAAALRAMLLSDLDVGMVSEFRDAPTFDLFFKAAHTGHLMLGVMHAATAAQCLRQIIEVGRVTPAMVASTLRGIVVQRLYRGSCPQCRELRPARPAEADALGLTGPARSAAYAFNAGCEGCRRTGFKDQVLVADVVMLDAKQRLALSDAATLADDGDLATAGRAALRRTLLAKIEAGELTPAEAMMQRG